MSSIKPRERFSTEVTLNPTLVSEFAKAAGDLNPMHHDQEFAANTRFKKVIASGTQTTALLLGATASYFSGHGLTVGLEFWQRFKKPVFADEKIKVELLIINVMPNEKLAGDIVDLRGRIRGSDGKTAVAAKGKVLVTDKL